MLPEGPEPSERRDLDGGVVTANSWIIVNLGGGPTDDKPAVTLETPRNPDRVRSFLNIRVADIQSLYEQWNARGAEFFPNPPPIIHWREIRAYIRDPDGHLIEVGRELPAPRAMHRLTRATSRQLSGRARVVSLRVRGGLRAPAWRSLLA